MTIDKIKHYIGDKLVSFICSLNKEQLTKMLGEAEKDMQIITSSEYEYYRFQRTVEIALIKYLLGL